MHITNKSVRFKQGYVVTGENDNVPTLEKALTLESTCGCGMDCCLGLITQISATDGSRVGIYVTGTDPYTLVVEAYDTAVTNTKALLAART